MIEYSDASMDDAAATWSRLAGFVQRASERVGAFTEEQVRTATLPKEFVEAMDDDLAVPRAMAHIHETVRAGNAAAAEGDLDALKAALLEVRAMLDVLGLDPASATWAASDTAASAAMGALDSLVRADIDARATARTTKDWATADAIRDRLATAGIVLEDSADGVRWSLAEEN
jgi:cysteinyl-tRNA synthetase